MPAPGQNYGQPAYGAPYPGQNAYYGAPGQQGQIVGDQAPAHVGVQNALTLDIVLAVIGLLGGIGSVTQNPTGSFGLVLDITWLVLIIVAFNSGYKQYPIKNAGFLGCYKVFRIIFYWFMCFAYAIGIVFCIIFGIILLSATTTNRETDAAAHVFGIALLICIPFLFLFLWICTIGIKTNAHFDRLLEGNNQPNLQFA